MENRDWLIGRKLFKLARAITNQNNAYLKELGITGAQAESLIFIADNQERTINDLKDYLGISHQAAQGIAKRMMDSNLIVIQKFEKDRRQKILTPTPKGLDIRGQLRGNALTTGGRLLSEVSAEEKEVFFNVLTKALEVIQKDKS